MREPSKPILSVKASPLPPANPPSPVIPPIRRTATAEVFVAAAAAVADAATAVAMAEIEDRNEAKIEDPIAVPSELPNELLTDLQNVTRSRAMLAPLSRAAR